MCGIAGIIGRLDERNAAALTRMNRAMAHRGPDASGDWQSTPDADGWGALLTHRRLAILDLSPAGRQPMIDPATGHVLTYNGELYNYVGLRESLAQAGERLPSDGDTAVLLRALGVRGRSALGLLRGMFAFAFWNRETRRLLLARDPLGMKPLYFMRSPSRSAGWSIAFASEVRALLASGLLEGTRLNLEAVAAYVWNGFTIGPGSIVEGIEQVQPGTFVEIDGMGAEVAREAYWRIPASQPTQRTNEGEVAEVIKESVRLHLASDVPLAVFLSGGIDSSAMANLAQKASDRQIDTFTLAFEDERLNEGPIARSVATAIGSRHHEVMLTEGDVVGSIDAALDSLDQPTFDGLNAYYISRAIRSAGFTVALSGTGGDELFGGYASFRELPLLYRAARHADWLPSQIRGGLATAATWPLNRNGGSIARQTRWAKLPAMARCGGNLIGLYQLAYSLFLPEFQRELLGSKAATRLDHGLTGPMHQQLVRETSERSAHSAISVLEHRLFLGERLLRDNDVASMAASLEQRMPLVDHVVFEAVDRLPDDVRFNPLGRKQCLRRIGLEGLPTSLFDRPKSGFVMPFDAWIRRGLKTTVEDTLCDRTTVAAAGLDPDAVARLWHAFVAGGPGLYWSRVWSLYALVRWCHRHRVHWR